jgi:hypothetical protein
MYTTHPRYPTPAEGPPSPPLRGVMSEAVAQANRGRVRPKLKLGVIAAVAALALALPSIASATNNWQIKSIEGAPNSNWCLDDTNWGLSPGTPLQLWQCLNPMSAHPNQQWYLTHINNAWCPNATPWDIPPQGICNVDLIHSVWAAQHGKGAPAAHGAVAVSAHPPSMTGQLGEPSRSLVGRDHEVH